MKKLLFTVVACFAAISFATAGNPEVKRVTQTDSGFYVSNEVTVSTFSASIFSDSDRDNTDVNFGGGMEVKYFMNRNFGLGIEAFGVNGDGTATGAALATATFRLPINDSRFAPYIFIGGGTTFGGGNGFEDNDARAMGTVGLGLETRVTPNVGVIVDVSENIINNSDNATMIRAGLNLAF